MRNMTGSNETETKRYNRTGVRKLARKVKGVRSSKLAKRLVLPMVLIVFLYACVFLGVIWYGGVLDQLKANEVERIQQSINRKVTAI